MKYELTHDAIAKQIYEKASTETKMRHKIADYISSKFELNIRYQYLLSQDDLDYISPYLASIHLKKEKKNFIQKSKQALQKAKNRKRNLIVGIIAILLLSTFISLFQWQNAKQKEQLANASALYNEGQLKAIKNPTLGIQLMQSAYASNQNDNYQNGIYQLYQNNILYEKKITPALEKFSLIDFSPDQKHFAIVLNEGKNIFIYNWENIVIDSLSKVGNDISSIAYSNSGQKIIATAHDFKTHIWDIPTQQTIYFPKTPERLKDDISASAIALSNDEKLLATARKKFFRIWDSTNNTRPIYEKQFPFEFNQLLFLQNTNDLLIGSSEGQIFLFSFADKSLKKLFRLSNSILQLGQTKKTKMIFAASADSLFIWKNKISSQANYIFSASEKNKFTAVHFSDDEKLVLAAESNNIIRSWKINPNDGQSILIDYILKGHSSNIFHIESSSEKPLIYSASSEGIIAWQWRSKHLDFVIDNLKRSTNALAFTGKNNSLCLASGDGKLTKLDFKKEQIIQQVNFHNIPITSISFNEDQQIGISADMDGNMIQWQIQEGGFIKKINSWSLKNNVNNINITFDNQILLASQEDSKELVFINLADQSIANLSDPTIKKNFFSISSSPNSQFAISTHRDSICYLWDLANKKITKKLIHPDKHIIAAVFIDNNNIATLSEKKLLYFWNTKNNSYTSITTLEKLNGLAYPKNTSFLFAYNKRGTIYIMDTKGNILQKIKSTPFTSFSVHPTGKHFCIGTEKGIELRYNNNSALLEGKLGQKN